MRVTTFIYACLILFFSCSNNKKEKEEIANLVYEWQGKEILFPENILFTRNGIDTLDFKPQETDFRVLTYVDFLDCTSCELQLPKWKEMIAYVDSVVPGKVTFFFFFKSKDFKEIRQVLMNEKFDHPVCADVNDELNQLNHFCAVFTLTNTGNQPLVILDAATTCGCAVVSFSKEPTAPGASLQVYIDITPKAIGFFDETISIKCNIPQPVKLKIRGQAT